jgi:hypothetical protein
MSRQRRLEFRFGMNLDGGTDFQVRPGMESTQAGYGD